VLRLQPTPCVTEDPIGFFLSVSVQRVACVPVLSTIKEICMGHGSLFVIALREKKQLKNELSPFFERKLEEIVRIAVKDSDICTVRIYHIRVIMSCYDALLSRSAGRGGKYPARGTF
jgi:hypothetical protein